MYLIKQSTDVGAGAKKEAQNPASNIITHVTSMIPIHTQSDYGGRPSGHGYWVCLALDLVLSGTKSASMLIFIAENA